jgi:hypothetical protein
VSEKKTQPAPPKPGRIDWPAVKRDYRTDRFTQVELAKKHGIAEATLSRKIKKDRKVNPDSWPLDLTEAVRQATNARVMAEMVKSEVIEGQEQVKNTVLAAAEIGAQVIIRHQSDLAKAREVAMGLLSELQGASLLVEQQELLASILAGGNPDEGALDDAKTAIRKALGIGTRISGVKAIADALAKLQERERTAYRLDEPEKPQADASALSDDELDERISARLARG